MLEAKISPLVEEAKRLSPTFEEQRHLSEGYVNKLKQAGLFRILLPAEAHGLGATFVDWMHVVQQLSMVSPSVGWSVAHGNIASAILYTRASPSLRARVFASPTANSALTNLTRVDAQATPDGLRINGTWGFVTGCMTADYISGLVKVTAQNKTPGESTLTTVVVPRDRVQIIDNWDTIGLSGTGSHDVAVNDLLIPWEDTLEWPAPWLGGASVSEIWPAFDACIPGTWLISLIPAATHLGIAKAAIETCTQALKGKRGTYTGAWLAQNAAVLRETESAASKLYACQAVFERTLERIWHEASSQNEITTGLRREMRLASVYTVQETYDVVRTAFQLSGAAAISKRGNLERLYRDASCLTNHVSVAKESLETTGRTSFELDEGAWL